MSFSSQLKISLSRQKPSKRCCRLAELSAIIRLCGKIAWEGEDPKLLTISSLSTAPMRKAYDLLIQLFKCEPHIEISSRKSTGKSRKATVRLDQNQGLGQILNELCILGEDFRNLQGVPSRLLKDHCCRLSYARGAFLGAGSLSNPHTSYHLEIVSGSDKWAAEFQSLLEKLEISAKSVQRKHSYVIYLKDSQEISAFLALIGGHHTLLEFEDVLVRRQVSSEINRLVNCDAANAGKTALASEKQLADIALIAQRYGLASLPAALQEIAEFRMSYPDTSIGELAELCTPPLSKSAVAHRFRRIADLAARERRSGS